MIINARGCHVCFCCCCWYCWNNRNTKIALHFMCVQDFVELITCIDTRSMFFLFCFVCSVDQSLIFLVHFFFGNQKKNHHHHPHQWNTSIFGHDWNAHTHTERPDLCIFSIYITLNRYSKHITHLIMKFSCMAPVHTHTHTSFVRLPEWLLITFIALNKWMNEWMNELTGIVW